MSLKKYEKRIVVVDKLTVLNSYKPCVNRVINLTDERDLSEFYADTFEEIVQLIKLAYPNSLLWVGELTEDLPNDLIYDETTGFVRAMTDKELIDLTPKELAENEYLVGDKIATFDTIYEYIDEHGIKQTKTREQLIKEKIITLETEKEKARREREKAFEALDLYDKAVLRGDIIESEEGKKARDEFRTAWLELPNNYTDITVPIEELYPETPKIIKYFE